MAFNLFGGKRRITKGFFANSLGNKQTRGIYTFQIDVENGELIFKKYFVTPTDPWYAFNYGRFHVLLIEIEQVLLMMEEFVLMQQQLKL